MIGDLFNNNKRREVKTREDQVMYLGKKYRRDPKTGYMVCTSGSRRRLHDVIWEAAHGMAIPKGCVVHHKDWDKTNNDIKNLLLVTHSEHNRLHNPPGGGARVDDERVIKLTRELEEQEKEKTRGVDGCHGGVL